VRLILFDRRGTGLSDRVEDELPALETNSITGNGTYSFALTGGSSDHAWFSSSEGANLPQLVVTP
jgi:hypothetical protein